MDVHVCRATENVDEEEEILSTNAEDVAEDVAEEEEEEIPIGDSTNEEVDEKNETT